MVVEPPPVVIVMPAAPMRDPLPPAPPIPPPPKAPPPRTSNEPGNLTVLVEPAGAEIYLDDRKWPAGGEPRPTLPGIHVLEVSHPEHGSERVVFAVEPETPAVVAIDLRETRPGRRTQVR